MVRPPEGYYVPVQKIRCAWVWHRCAHCGSRMRWEPAYNVSTSFVLAYPSQHDREHRIVRAYYAPTSQDLCLSCAERILGPDPLHLKPNGLEKLVESFFEMSPPPVVEQETVSSSPVQRISLGVARSAKAQSNG